MCSKSPHNRISLLPLMLLLAGCSAKDPPNYTPVYKFGVQTNRSSVNSWELNREPVYTQPGVNGGKAVTVPVIRSQRGFEPYDPVAEQVYIALNADGVLPARYLSARAKNGVVLLAGTVQTMAQKARAEAVARGVAGVKQVRNGIRIVAPGSGP